MIYGKNAALPPAEVVEREIPSAIRRIELAIANLTAEGDAVMSRLHPVLSYITEDKTDSSCSPTATSLSSRLYEFASQIEYINAKTFKQINSRLEL